MTNIFKNWLAPITMITLLFGGMLTLVVPTFVSNAHAVSTSTTLTTSEILPPTFSDETGLGEEDLRSTIAGIIRAALGFLGIVAVAIILYGGFLWMTASGSPEKVQKAQQVIVQAAIGLAIILSAWAITTFVISELLGATSAVVE